MFYKFREKYEIDIQDQLKTVHVILFVTMSDSESHAWKLFDYLRVHNVINCNRSNVTCEEATKEDYENILNRYTNTQEDL